jgi:FkbM family methyltransferase
MWQLRKRLSPRSSHVVTLPGGARMYCHADSSIGSQMFYFGPYTEYHELQFMTRFLRPGDGVIDAGANIGLYSLLAAPLVGPEGRVDAFEPGEGASGRFQANMDANAYAHVHLHRAALADREGDTTFSTGWDVSNRIVTGEGVTVPTVTLDTALSGEHYAYAKLDVEGAEYLALQGAAERLAAREPPVWQVEVFGSMLDEMGAGYDEVIDLLRGHGYRIASYDADRNTLVETDEHSSAKNILAIADDRWSWVCTRLVGGT